MIKGLLQLASQQAFIFCWGEKLTLDRVGYVFNCFANFASRLTETFLYLSTGIVSLTFVLQVSVINGPSHRFFHLSLSLIKFAFQLIFVWNTHVLNLHIVDSEVQNAPQQ
jgi:hypothetical protein